VSKSNKWKHEWSFFLDTDGKRKYNDQCRHCAHSCKQSFRVAVVVCQMYLSKRSTADNNCQKKG